MKLKDDTDARCQGMTFHTTWTAQFRPFAKCADRLCQHEVDDVLQAVAASKARRWRTAPVPPSAPAPPGPDPLPVAHSTECGTQELEEPVDHLGRRARPAAGQVDEGAVEAEAGRPPGRRPAQLHPGSGPRLAVGDLAVAGRPRAPATRPAVMTDSSTVRLASVTRNSTVSNLADGRMSQ